MPRLQSPRAARSGDGEITALAYRDRPTHRGTVPFKIDTYPTRVTAYEVLEIHAHTSRRHLDIQAVYAHLYETLHSSYDARMQHGPPMPF